MVRRFRDHVEKIKQNLRVDEDGYREDSQNDDLTASAPTNSGDWSQERERLEENKNSETVADGAGSTASKGTANFSNDQTPYTWQDLEQNLIAAYSEQHSPLDNRFSAADVVTALTTSPRPIRINSPEFPIKHKEETYEKIESMLQTLNAYSDVISGKYLATETGEDTEHPFTRYHNGKTDTDPLVPFYEINENAI